MVKGVAGDARFGPLITQLAKQSHGGQISLNGRSPKQSHGGAFLLVVTCCHDSDCGMVSESVNAPTRKTKPRRVPPAGRQNEPNELRPRQLDPPGHARADEETVARAVGDQRPDDVITEAPCCSLSVPPRIRS